MSTDSILVPPLQAAGASSAQMALTWFAWPQEGLEANQASTIATRRTHRDRTMKLDFSKCNLPGLCECIWHTHGKEENQLNSIHSESHLGRRKLASKIKPTLLHTGLAHNNHQLSHQCRWSLRDLPPSPPLPTRRHHCRRLSAIMFAPVGRRWLDFVSTGIAFEFSGPERNDQHNRPPRPLEGCRLRRHGRQWHLRATVNKFRYHDIVVLLVSNVHANIHRPP